MSNFNLSKTLQKPARKAWKSFKNQLLTKLHNPKFVKAITTLRQHCSTVWQSFYILIHRKFHALANRKPRSHFYHHNHRSHRRLSPIFVDELFPEAASAFAKRRNMVGNSGASFDKPSPEVIIKDDQSVGKVSRQVEDKRSVRLFGESEKRLDAGKGKAKAGETSRSTSDQWKVPLLPQFRGIDERAEEFIAKFRQDMKLEREQSIVEFQEMLKRSA